MKGRAVVLGTFGGAKAAALMVDGRLEDLFLDPVGAPGVGAIYRAVVDRPVKGQGGVFVKLPEGSAFLRQARDLAPGQAALVQVTGVAEPGKAVPVTSKILFKSRYAIVTPDAPGLNVSRMIRDDDERDRLLEIAHEAMQGCAPHLGLILRSACKGVDGRAIAEDIAAMRALSEQICADAAGGPELLLEAPDAHLRAWHDWASPDPDAVFDAPDAFVQHGIDEALAALSGPAILPGGGELWVEPARALVAVDVNTGPDTSPAAGLKANLAAARELPRQLRLRGLGGQIVVDFAPMPKKDRRQVEQALRAALRVDPVETTFIGWTALGHVELTRKRERPPLGERGA
ncbi:Rne/Rng family ribonuclease [Rhodovulum imhoffii]|uniref:Rne/Rng family ribonuclease n=1 Tax=Rhodovulum imhoffii TaxID=365340 RepID=A0A2T5BR39_9RHOB|nr:ribonuclease E/G [Rhodovulum imhoffii]MBK5932592.1 ribonuclease G [Rhodovulum imhoffii]PTN01625.1 Rne/Rng family ribonuclease [Rhodovulum imhoffii]